MKDVAEATSVEKANNLAAGGVFATYRLRTMFLCCWPMESTRESCEYLEACLETLMSILRYYQHYSRPQPRFSLP